jgi:hypothetical protein
MVTVSDVCHGKSKKKDKKKQHNTAQKIKKENSTTDPIRNHE